MLHPIHTKPKQTLTLDSPSPSIFFDKKGHEKEVEEDNNLTMNAISTNNSGGDYHNFIALVPSFVQFEDGKRRRRRSEGRRRSGGGSAGTHPIKKRSQLSLYDRAIKHSLEILMCSHYDIIMNDSCLLSYENDMNKNSRLSSSSCSEEAIVMTPTAIDDKQSLLFENRSRVKSIRENLISLCSRASIEQDAPAAVLLGEFINQLPGNESVDQIRNSSQHGSSLMHLCAQKNLVSCMEVLIEAGASVDCLDSIQATPLFYACAQNCLEASAFLLSKSASVNIKDMYSSFPLMITMKHQFFKVAELLFLFSADINQKGAKGNTCLHVMAQHGCLTGIKLLIQHQASLLRLNDNGDSALSLCLTHVECLYYLCKQADNNTCLRLLMLKNKNDQNLIHMCCELGYYNSLRILLKVLCSKLSTQDSESLNSKLLQLLNEVDGQGRTPLMLSVIGNHLEIVESLHGSGSQSI